jgi:hypothetical protein
MKIFLLLSALLFLPLQNSAQESNYLEFGRLYRLELKNAPFPSPGRSNGYTYRGTHYPMETHYNDSTVLVFVPDTLKAKRKVDIVVYFHGWNNNVDTVLSKFKIIEQFHASGKQAILVMPEGPKNAPDSFGGKLEEKRRFRLFIDELLSKLKTVSSGYIDYIPGDIILAGHSGAYRVIAYILMRGGVTNKIKEVYLFDGLYADVEKYSYWLDHYNGRFIDIYTPDGGTKGESENLMECLTAWDIPYIFIDGDNFTNQQLMSGRIIFIRSSLEHNQVISSRNQFRKFLETSRLR